MVMVALLLVSGLVIAGSALYGLLGEPDVGVVGAGSVPGTVRWFVDQSESGLPEPLMVQLPVWVWRVLALSWTLWAGKWAVGVVRQRTLI